MVSRHAPGHAIVVGGSSGIGAATARTLEERGWDVTVLSRRPANGTRGRWIECDVAGDASVDGAVGRAIDQAGPPRAVVYSAGLLVAGRTLAVPPERARDVFEVNFWGVQRVVRRVFPVMAERREGTIMAVLSIAALRAIPFEADYAASKAACARWLECFALEAARDGVRVGYLAPGFVPTGFLERSGWHGMQPPKVSGSNVDAGDVGRAVVELVEGRRRRAVFGWRETAITVADRLLPGAYDRLLRARIRGDG